MHNSTVAGFRTRFSLYKLDIKARRETIEPSPTGTTSVKLTEAPRARAYAGCAVARAKTVLVEAAVTLNALWLNR
jgi:hypothetical protein